MIWSTHRCRNILAAGGIQDAQAASRARMGPARVFVHVIMELFMSVGVHVMVDGEREQISLGGVQDACRGMEENPGCRGVRSVFRPR